jgi:hypothetical protein
MKIILKESLIAAALVSAVAFAATVPVPRR